jgi:serine/threonine-protein kinase
MIGRTLAHFRVLEQIGEGGMGVVYLGEDTRLHRRVAIKVVSGAARSDPEARARFLLEARAASALDHPNICAIHHIDETDEGTPFLVMAHYGGETLDRRLGRGPLPLGQAIDVVAQVAQGLAHAHARGVIHRDIKPSNVLLTDDGAVKILDFGLAKLVGAASVTATGVSLGTPSYMSPEQVRAEPVDARADVWACGVLLYALVAGRSPFEGENLGQVTYAILERDPVPLERLLGRVPPGLSSVLARCLAKRAVDRFPDAGALAAELRALHTGLDADESAAFLPATSEARTLVMPTPKRRLGRHAPRVKVAVAATLAAVIGVAAFLAWRLAQPAEPLRVAVLAAAVSGEPDSLAAADAASSARSALLAGLAALRGISPLDASDVRGVSGWRQLVTALAADDVLSLALTRAGEDWRVEMRRRSAADSSVRWAGEFSVRRDASLPLHDALRAHLARAYPDSPPRRGERLGAIAAEDYAEFLRIERHFRRNFANDVLRDEMAQRLARLRRAAPDFLGVHLLEAEWARYQYETNRMAGDLALALESAERARRLAPEDPRPLVARFAALTHQGEWDRAGAVLDELARLTPGDPEVEFQRARLLEGRGDRAAGIAALERLIRRRPARHYLERLIRMQYGAGRYADARTRLEALSRDYPEHLFPRSYLAQLELLYGEPARAESLYAQLVVRYSRVTYLSNLGLAQLLQARYDAAASSLTRALELSPEDAGVRLNLADCELLRGRVAEAEAIYRSILRRVSARTDSATWDSRLIEAQCLAHLGRGEESVAIALDVLRTEGENADALFQSALIHALSGESTSATVHARRAIELGIQPRWFELPWFDRLRRDARFQEALRSTPRAGS